MNENAAWTPPAGLRFAKTASSKPRPATVSISTLRWGPLKTLRDSSLGNSELRPPFPVATNVIVTSRDLIEPVRVHRPHSKRATEGKEFADPIVGFEAGVNTLGRETTEGSIKRDQFDVRFGDYSHAHAGSHRRHILVRAQPEVAFGLLRVAEDHGRSGRRHIMLQAVL
jgi:hypothetical protein